MKIETRINKLLALIEEKQGWITYDCTDKAVVKSLLWEMFETTEFISSPPLTASPGTTRFKWLLYFREVGICAGAPIDPYIGHFQMTADGENLFERSDELGQWNAWFDDFGDVIGSFYWHQGGWQAEHLRN